MGRTCSRCGSTTTVNGVILDHSRGVGQTQPLVFVSKTLEPILLEAFLCTDCGLVEIVAHQDFMQERFRLKCDKCGAIYTYKESDLSKRDTVICQNCGKEILVPYDMMLGLDLDREDTPDE